MAIPDVATDERMPDPVETPEDKPRDSEMNAESPTGITFFFAFFSFLSVT